MIKYEFPLNERIRKFMRVEEIFTKIDLLTTSKKNYTDFINDCELVKRDKIKKTKNTKSNYKIAFDLFMNYELQYSDLEDEHVRTLEDDYNIKPEDTEKYFVRFMSYCLNNDLI